MKLDLKAYAEKHPALAAQVDLTPAAKRSKYGNRKTEYNGVLYHSALEAAAAAHLDNLIRQGYVKFWRGQVRYDLYGGVTYIADFHVVYQTGRSRNIDLKGFETDVFKIKRKLFEERYGPLDVVKRWQEIPLEGRVEAIREVGT